MARRAIYAVFAILAILLAAAWTITLTSPAAPEPSTAITVYVTDTGTKYHRANCQYLRHSRIPMTLNRASGPYGPCSVCQPPQ